MIWSPAQRLYRWFLGYNDHIWFLKQTVLYIQALLILTVCRTICWSNHRYIFVDWVHSIEHVDWPPVQPRIDNRNRNTTSERWHIRSNSMATMNLAVIGQLVSLLCIRTMAHYGSTTAGCRLGGLSPSNSILRARPQASATTIRVVSIKAQNYCWLFFPINYWPWLLIIYHYSDILHNFLPDDWLIGNL